MRKPALAVAMGIVLVACGDGGGVATIATDSLPAPTPTVETTVPSEPTTPSTDQATTSVPSTGASTSAGGEAVPVDLLEPLLLDAANRADVPVGDVTIVETQFRDFSDSSLGCPQPGMMYTQVITPGYRVVLEAGGTKYDYRMNRRGAFRLCENPGAIPDVRTPSTVIPTQSTVAGD